MPFVFYENVEALKKTKRANRLLLTLENKLNEYWTEAEVLGALTAAKNGAPGPDKLSNKILKAVFGREEDAKPLTALINALWRLGTIPDTWKHSIKKPFHKKGPLNNLDNYPGIALICCTAKILERLIDNRIREFATKHKLISPIQGRFRRNRGAAVNLLTVIENGTRQKPGVRPCGSHSWTSKRRTTKYFGRACSNASGTRESKAKFGKSSVHCTQTQPAKYKSAHSYSTYS